MEEGAEDGGNPKILTSAPSAPSSGPLRSPGFLSGCLETASEGRGTMPRGLHREPWRCEELVSASAAQRPVRRPQLCLDAESSL
jgi:hypothetical protein